MTTPPLSSRPSSPSTSPAPLPDEKQREIAATTRLVALVATLLLLALASFVFLPWAVALPLVLSVAIILTSLSYTSTGTHLFYRVHCVFFPSHRSSIVVVQNPAPPGGIYVPVPSAPTTVFVDQRPAPSVVVLQQPSRPILAVRPPSPPMLGSHVPSGTRSRNPFSAVASSAAYQQGAAFRPPPTNPAADAASRIIPGNRRGHG